MELPTEILKVAADTGVSVFFNCDTSLGENINFYAKTKADFRRVLTAGSSALKNLGHAHAHAHARTILANILARQGLKPFQWPA